MPHPWLPPAQVLSSGVARIGVHYLQNKEDAEQTARLVEQHGGRATLRERFQAD